MSGSGKDDSRGEGAGPPSPATLPELLEQYRNRLRRMVDLRMDQRLKGRIDASDVIQEAYVEVMERLPTYRESPNLPFFVWVRFLAGQKLLQFHRRHLGSKKRDARREIHLEYGGAPGASSVMLASALAAGGMESPSQAAVKKEQVRELELALDAMEPIDREVLVLRHFEHLSNVEVAHILGLSEPGASLKYLRAARKLRDIMNRIRDGQS